MAVFGAVISYFMQCLAFIMLRRKLPNIERPYRSPVGVWGAAIAGAIALVALVSLFLNADYRPGVVGTLIYFLIGIDLLRGRRAAQARAVARRGVRAFAGPVRSEPGTGGLRRDVRDRDRDRRHADSLNVS